VTVRGRGAGIDVPNRFEPILLDPADTQLPDTDLAGPTPAIPARYLQEHCRTALTYNDSPDIPFEVSLNPYRGCEHGCSYCYARPSHEYFGLSAGLEFETVIFCKTGLAERLREDLAARTYRPSTITLSGITDAYQPVERRLRITRACLELLTASRHPVDIITKSHLVTRDLDLLGELAKHQAARVDISLTSLDNEVAARMEPRAASPARRLEAIAACREAGVPVGVLCSPIIPGLTDHELPRLLQSAADAGAQWAHMIPLRLPGAVAPVFLDWLERNHPDRYDKVLNRQRELKGGKLNDARFGHRFEAQGPFYDHLRQILHLYRKKLGLADHGPKLSTEHFRKPERDGGQMRLF
jgi:DNA repair photolyase